MVVRLLSTTTTATTTAAAAAGGRPDSSRRRLAAAVNSRRRASAAAAASHSRPLLREDLLLLAASSAAKQQHSSRRRREHRQHNNSRWVVASSSSAAAAAAADGGGGGGPTDADQWRVRQVYGDGKVLLDQLREVAELLADGFNASGRTSKDLLNGLVQKVRWSGGNFVCLVADDGGDGSEMVGACDLTLLPAGGPKKSREGLVADVPSQLALDDDAHFLYLTAGRHRGSSSSSSPTSE